MKRPREKSTWTRYYGDSFRQFQLFLPLKYFLASCKFFFCEGSGADLFGGGLTSLIALPLRALTFGVIACADRLRTPLLEFLNRSGGASMTWGRSAGGCRCRTPSATCSTLRTEVRFSSRERVRLRPDEFERFDNRDVPGPIERVEGSFESPDALGKDNAFAALAVHAWGLFEWPLPSDPIFKDKVSELRLNVKGFDDHDVLERDDEPLAVPSSLWTYALSSGIDEVESRRDALEGLDDTKENPGDVGCERLNDSVRAWSTGDLVLTGDHTRWAGEDLAVASFSCRYSL